MNGPSLGTPLHDELIGVLDDITTTARSVLGDSFVGAYLQGSVAQGDADMESDCDFLVLTSEPVSATQFDELAALHRRLPHAAGHWTRHIEGSYAVASEFASLEDLGSARWPYIDHGQDTLEWSNHCDTVPARVIMRDHGIVLAGPPAAEVSPVVPVDMVVADAAARLTRELPVIDDWAFNDAWSQRISVLNLARMGAALRTGRIMSKRAGAEWAAEQWNGRWANLVLAMLAARGTTSYWDDPDPAWMDEQRAFFQWVRHDVATGVSRDPRAAPWLND